MPVTEPPAMVAAPVAWMPSAAVGDRAGQDRDPGRARPDAADVLADVAADGDRHLDSGGRCPAKLRGNGPQKGPRTG
jgi:hypothetical protein